MEEQFALNKALLERLNRGETLIGTHITCNDPLLTELIGNAGFDYLWIDTEHTYIEKTMLINHLIAARTDISRTRSIRASSRTVRSCG